MRRYAPVLAAVLAATPALAADANHPLVVELFQSQGCSSCPPANASLIEFVKRPNVLALTFAVDYWDRLGWKDTFSSPTYTARQYAYARSLPGGVYTPETIINGRVAGVGDTVDEIEQLARQGDRGTGGPNVRIEGDAAVVGAGVPPHNGAEVWLALFDPRVVEVSVARGENAGRTLPHTHVVHGLTKLGAWTGAETRFPLPANAQGYSRAVIVQGAGVGAVIAAARG